MAGDRYRSFDQIRRENLEGVDYEVTFRRKDRSRVLVIAPHGGTIEPRTDQIADAIAAQDFSYYAFRALRPGSGMHLASHLFDEPICLTLVRHHDVVISLHGWRAAGTRVCVGGKDPLYAKRFVDRLKSAGFLATAAAPSLAARDPMNITNRGRSGRGVQFEMTRDFRRNNRVVGAFVKEVRKILMLDK